MIQLRCENAGLGNRLRALIGSYALAKLLNIPLLLSWRRDSSCDLAAGDILAPFPPDIVPQDAPDAEFKESIGFAITDMDWPDDIWSIYGRPYTSWRRYVEMLRIIIGVFRAPEPIASHINRARSSLSASRLIGFHIRNTDNLTTYSHWKLHARGKFEEDKKTDVVGFSRYLTRMPLGTQCFLATDDFNVESSFKRAYPSQIVTLPKLYREPSKCGERTTSTHSSVLDFYMLAHCDEVVGTYYSSFGRMSAILGGIKYSEVQSVDTIFDPVIPSRCGLLRNSDIGSPRYSTPDRRR